MDVSLSVSLLNPTKGKTSGGKETSVTERGLFLGHLRGWGYLHCYSVPPFYLCAEEGSTVFGQSFPILLSEGILSKSIHFQLHKQIDQDVELLYQAHTLTEKRE